MRFLIQDLYNSPGTSTPAVASRPSNFGLNFNFLPNNWGDILLGFNNFALVWSVFISMMFVADFYFYYVKQSDSEIAREVVGQKALWQAARIWWRFLPGLALTILYVFVSGWWASVVAVLGIIAFVIKFWQDIYDFLGITTYFDWYNSFSNGFRRVLKPKFASRKKKK